jgi:SOS-response transcriptional repressor LexA
MAEISENTLTVWRYISSYIDEHGYAPSRREIATACFIGRSQVRAHLDKLEKRGAIEHTDGLARGIRLLDRVPLAAPVIAESEASA